VLDELRTLPFFSKRRLVIVEEADPFVSKYRKDLEAYVEHPFESGTLLLQCKQWMASTNLAKHVARRGTPIDCGSPREAEVAPWLCEAARSRLDTEIDMDAARLLVELVGNEPGILACEVEKLSVYAGAARRVERDDVMKLVGGGRVETIWKTIDAAATGQAREALVLIDNLLGAGEQPTPMLAAMSTSVLKVHHAGGLRAARLDLDEACRLAGIPSFAVEKTRKQHAHLGPSRADRLPEMLLRADFDLKGGSLLEPRIVLEMLMVELAIPRTD
jgi:DNA polymerase-3 subunit delta